MIVLSFDMNFVNVYWFFVVNDSVNGVLRGYKVFYCSFLDEGMYLVVIVGLFIL